MQELTLELPAPILFSQLKKKKQRDNIIGLAGTSPTGMAV